MCRPTNTRKTNVYDPMLSELRSTFASNKTKELSWRREQLRQLKRMVHENHEQLTAAIRADLGGYKMRGIFDLMGSVKEADHALKNLDRWTKPKRVTHDDGLPINVLSKSEIRYEAKGVVLIISPWNYPIELALTPLVSAIAAGNCAVIKPSEISVNSTAALAELIPRYMDQTAIRVECGAVEETTLLLQLRWDHIMYTGNGAVARIVMAAAARHLTPVTLELGGKSPVYIDESCVGSKMDLAVERISFAKWTNAGQTCVAPDYVLVHEKVKKTFLEKMEAQAKAAFGETEALRKKSPDFCRIINARHTARLLNLVSSTSAKTVIGGEFAPESSCGGEKETDQNYVPPTILLEPELSDAVMREEIFGPLLPVLGVSSAEEAVKTINTVCDTPLALYVYSENNSAVESILGKTRSGGVCVNSSIEQFLNHHLPFGGVGASGMGMSHGKHGFDEFTHKRSVMHKDTTLVTAGVPYHHTPLWLYDAAVTHFIGGYWNWASKAVSSMASFGVGAPDEVYMKLAC